MEGPRPTICYRQGRGHPPFQTHVRTLLSPTHPGGRMLHCKRNIRTKTSRIFNSKIRPMKHFALNRSTYSCICISTLLFFILGKFLNINPYSALLPTTACWKNIFKKVLEWCMKSVRYGKCEWTEYSRISKRHPIFIGFYVDQLPWIFWCCVVIQSWSRWAWVSLSWWIVLNSELVSWKIY